MQHINLTVDGEKTTIPQGTTILEAAQGLGILIPTICYLEHTTANGLCRICVVEVEGARRLVTACNTPVGDDMIIQTQTERVRSVRRTILEMLASTVDLSEDLVIQAYMQEYEADPGRFPAAESRGSPVIDDNAMYVRDYAKCILCWRCVQVCAEDAQYTYAINFSGRGFHTSINTFYELPLPETTCVFCGNCIGVCPTGALKPKKEWLLQQGFSTDEIMRLTRQERMQKTSVPG